MKIRKYMRKQQRKAVVTMFVDPDRLKASLIKTDRLIRKSLFDRFGTIIQTDLAEVFEDITNQ